MSSASSAKPPVVVGVNDDPGSILALSWAVTEAVARRAPLRIIVAFQRVLRYWDGGFYDGEAYDFVGDAEVKQVRGTAEQLAAQAENHARTLDAHVVARGEAVEGYAVDVLAAESKRAAAVVVGSRQLKALGSTVLGSVGSNLAAQTRGPVVVVRGPAGSRPEGAAVVVGVDGRDAAEPQLSYAFEHADRHYVPLRAVLCWRPDLLVAARWHRDLPQRAEVWLAEVLAGWRERFPGVRVHASVRSEHPVAGLVTEAASAHLLVVGAHCRHALAGTLVGSVAQGVLHHATCPVAVIPNRGSSRSQMTE